MKLIYNIKKLEEISGKKTVIHDLHPLIKVLVTLFYIIAVISFNKYDLTGPLSLIAYQIVNIVLAGVPVTALARGVMSVIPLIVAIGVFNPLFDRSLLVVLPGLAIPGGWVSFCTVLLKGMLSVSAALILVSTTGISGITAALQTAGVPKIFILQLILIYRYMTVLGEEAGRMVRAYTLRSPCCKGIAPAHWGTFAGQLLLRATDRAQRIYYAMCCRGFRGSYDTGRKYAIRTGDILYLTLWFLYIATVCCFNIPESLGFFLMGAGQWAVTSLK